MELCDQSLEQLPVLLALSWYHAMLFSAPSFGPASLEYLNYKDAYLSKTMARRWTSHIHKMKCTVQPMIIRSEYQAAITLFLSYSV